MRIVFLCISTIILMAFVGCSDQDPLSSYGEIQPLAKPTVKMVPFKGDFVGAVINGGGPPGGCEAWGNLPRALHISGQATHLGKSTFIGDHCFVVEDIINWENPGDPLHFVAGVGAWTAANGDELHCTYEGVGEIITLDPAEGGPKGPFTVEMVFTGGTGRFEGAEGVVIGTGYTSPGEGGLSVSIEGTISSVGSSQ